MSEDQSYTEIIEIKCRRSYRLHDEVQVITLPVQDASLSEEVKTACDTITDAIHTLCRDGLGHGRAVKHQDTSQAAVTADPPFAFDNLAGQFYAVYCAAVGGKAFNGDPLPDWETFRADESKKVQSDAWVRVAETAQELKRVAVATRVNAHRDET